MWKNNSVIDYFPIEKKKYFFFIFENKRELHVLFLVYIFTYK